MPDSNFIYLLPSTSNNTITVKTGLSLEYNDINSFRGNYFIFKLNDTVTSMRAGRVINVSNDIYGDEWLSHKTQNPKNIIQIEHKDGTIASYLFTSSVKHLIKIGDFVMPGDPIALFVEQGDNNILFVNIRYTDAKNFQIIYLKTIKMK